MSSTNSGLNLRFAPKSSPSGLNSIAVPLRSPVFAMRWSFLSLPFANSTTFDSPSRTASARYSTESAFTAFCPTPFSPTAFLKVSLSYLAPVLMIDTQSRSLPSGIPRPKSRTRAFVSSRSISIFLPWPIVNSSTELSIVSLRST